MTLSEGAGIGVILGLLVQTGALFYWGGGVRQMLKDHERRLNEGHEKFTQHDRRLRGLETGE